MSTDIKLRKAQISKIIQLGGYLFVLMSNLCKAMGKKATTDLGVPLAKDVLPGLVSNIASNAA